MHGNAIDEVPFVCWSEENVMLVDDSTSSFGAFHCLITDVVFRVVSSLRPWKPFICYYLHTWRQFKFSGSKVLSEVCGVLGLHKFITAYMKFVHCIPMLNILFQYDVWSENKCVIHFFMSIQTFYHYLV